MIKKLTEQYISCFNNKDIQGVGCLLSEGFILEDPVVKQVIGKANALNAIKSIFDSNEKLQFEAKNIFVDGAISIIEFSLILNEHVLSGADIVEWDPDGKMINLRAYLDVPK